MNTSVPGLSAAHLCASRPQGIVKQFFNEKEVTSTLVMDALYSGCTQIDETSHAVAEVRAVWGGGHHRLHQTSCEVLSLAGVPTFISSAVKCIALGVPRPCHSRGRLCGWRGGPSLCHSGCVPKGGPSLCHSSCRVWTGWHPAFAPAGEECVAWVQFRKNWKSPRQARALG